MPRDDFWVTDGSVFTITQSADTVYVGGNFLHAGPYTGGGAAIDATTGLLTGAFPKVNGEIHASQPDGAGGWYIGGKFTGVGGVPRNNIARVLASGAVDATFNPNADNEVESLLLSGGTLFVGGVFDTIGGQARSRIAALNASTGSATSWNPSADGPVFTMYLSGTTLYTGGFFSQIGGQPRNNIAALDTNTGQATAWNPNANHAVNTMDLADSLLYVGGDFTTIGGQTRNRVAALDTGTGAPNGWNPNANLPVTKVLVSGNTVFVGGFFITIGGQTRWRIAQVNNTNGNATGWNANATSPPNNNENWPMNDMIVSGNTIYVGGGFARIGGQDRRGLAALDTTTATATAWNPNANGRVHTLSLANGVMFAGGSFTTVNMQARSNAAAFDIASGQATAWNPNANNVVLELTSHDGVVYAGGNFTTIGGQNRNFIAALDPVTGAASGWNPNANSAVRSIAVQDTTVYAAGYFATIGGQSRNRIAALSATTGLATAWNPNANDTVYRVLPGDGVVYAAGRFMEMGGIPRNYIAAIDPATGVPTNWDPNADRIVQTLALSSNGGTVYAGGFFAEIGGAPRSRIAALDAATGAATAWNPAVNDLGIVLDIVASGSRVFAGGGFSSIGGVPRSRVVGIDALTGAANDWAPPLNGPTVHALSLSNDYLFVGGNFHNIGLDGPSSLAAFQADGPMAIEVDPSETGPTNAASIEFSVTFDKPVVNFNSPSDVVVTHSGTAHTGVTISGGPEQYTVTIEGISGTGFFTLAVNSASNVQDLEGNSLISSVVSDQVFIDNTPPLVVVGNPAPAVGTVATDFNFPVTVVDALTSSIGAGNVSIQHGGTAGGTITVLNGGTASPTIRVSGVTGDGAFTVSVGGGVATDLAGNASLPSGPSPAAIVSNTLPLVSVGAPSPSIGNALTVFEFPVTVVNAASVNINLSNVTVIPSGVNIGPVSVLNGGSLNPVIRVGGVTGEGAFTVMVEAGVAQSPLGEFNLATPPSDPATVDNTPPQISISEPSVTQTNTGPVVYVVGYTGADAVTLSPAHITLQSTGTAGASVSVSGSGTSQRTVTLLNITGEGSLNILIAPGTASDLAGNLASAAGSPSVFAVKNAVIAPPIITTNGGNGPGQNFTTSSPVINLAGTVQAGVSEMRINGAPFPYIPNNTVWAVPVGLLALGPIVHIEVVARDSFGNQSDPAAITITYDASGSGGDSSFPPILPGTPAAGIAALAGLGAALLAVGLRRRKAVR